MQLFLLYHIITKYYIETIEDFDERKYNNIKELRLPKQEYAILSGIVNSESNIKPGRNYIETTNATYEVYFKDTGEFKVIDKIVDGGYNDTITNGNIQGTGNTRNAESGLQVHSSTVQQSRTRTHNDEISNFNKKRTRISDKSSGNGSSNSSNVKYSIRKSENNSGGAYGLNQWKPIGLNALTFSFWDAILFMEADCKVIFVLGFFFHNHFLKLFLLIN